MSDWTLDAGGGSPQFGDVIVATTPYRNYLPTAADRPDPGTARRNGGTRCPRTIGPARLIDADTVLCDNAGGRGARGAADRPERASSIQTASWPHT